MSEERDKFAEAAEYIEDLIRREVAAGFNTAESILTSAAVAVEDKLERKEREVFKPIAHRLLHDSLTAHYREQATWPDRTDCDRLDEAFTELDSRGIVSR